MQYKYAYFGNSVNAEGQMQEFIDRNWDRIVSFGFSESIEAEPFEVPGWYVRYAKSAIVSDSAKVSKKSDSKKA